MSDRSSTKRPRTGALAVEPSERAALRRVPAGARAARRHCRCHRRRQRRWRSGEHTPGGRFRRRRRAKRRRMRAAARCPAGSQAVPCERSAAGAVGDGRVDAGAAEPGRVRAAALERAVGDVLRARSRRRAAGCDEPVGGGNRRAPQRAVPAARGRRAGEPRQQARSSMRAGRFSSRATATTPTRPRRRRSRSSSVDRRGSCWPSSRRWCGETATGSTCSRPTGRRRCR